MNNETELDDVTYRLTVKGYLQYITGFNSTETDEIWNKLMDFIKKRANENGMYNGVPCLIFDNGGICYLADKIDNDEEIYEIENE